MKRSMDSVNKTLYIPLYGKAYVSKRSLFLKDERAERIWEAEGFPLERKAKSKWLAFYMGIRSAVFDDWLKEEMRAVGAGEGVAIIHLGCGMDSRAFRIGDFHPMWYDVDFPEVIAERKRYYTEGEGYQMLAGDARDAMWLARIPQRKKAIILMEGVSMYLSPCGLSALMGAFGDHFSEVSLLMDAYTVFAAKMSKYKNPVREVGVTTVYGIDDPGALQNDHIRFVKEHDMTPKRYVEELHGMEKRIFRRLYAGRFARRLYKLYEYKK